MHTLGRTHSFFASGAAVGETAAGNEVAVAVTASLAVASWHTARGAPTATTVPVASCAEVLLAMFHKEALDLCHDDTLWKRLSKFLGLGLSGSARRTVCAARQFSANQRARSLSAGCGNQRLRSATECRN